MRLVRPVPTRLEGRITVRRTYTEHAAGPRPLDSLRAVSAQLGNAVARSRGVSPFSRDGEAVIKAVEKRIEAAKTKDRGQDLIGYAREQCEQLTLLLSDLGLQVEAVEALGVSIPAVVITAGSGHPELDRIIFSALAPNAMDANVTAQYGAETRRFAFVNGRLIRASEGLPLAS